MWHVQVFGAVSLLLVFYPSLSATSRQSLPRVDSVSQFLPTVQLSARTGETVLPQRELVVMVITWQTDCRGCSYHVTVTSLQIASTRTSYIVVSAPLDDQETISFSVGPM